MRLIDADKCYRDYCSGFEGAVSEGEMDRMAYQISAAPTINPVHAAGACYCRECKNNPDLKTRTKGMLWCRQWHKEVKQDDFCSYGERRENNG